MDLWRKVDTVIKTTLHMLIFFGILFSGLGELLAASDKPLAVLTVEISRKTNYEIYPGENAGELIMKMEAYPKTLIEQLERQFGRHFVAMKVLNRRGSTIEVMLIILPVRFQVNHTRQVEAQRIKIYILPPEEDKDKDKVKRTVPDPPPLPFWEMLSEETVVLPVVQYRNIQGSGERYNRFQDVVRLYEMGAYPAAIKQLRSALTTVPAEEDDLRSEKRVLLGEMLLHQALRNLDLISDARMELVIAEQETENPIWKSYALLMLGYASYFNGLLNDAKKTFDAGTSTYPEMAQYFKLGLLQIALKRQDLDEGEKLIAAIESHKDLDEAGKKKLCFSKTVFTLIRGYVAEANRLVDRCILEADPTRPLELGQLLVESETRLQSYRYGEALQELESIRRDFPDHSKAPLAALRRADILYLEKHYRESLGAYLDVSNRWPGTSYQRIAELKANELQSHETGEEDPLKIYRGLDMHHEDEMVAREVRMRLLWNYENSGQTELAYLYMVELVRRYGGLRFWPFAPKRFSEIVLDGYRDKEINGDHLGIINLYLAKTPFPLDHEAKDKIAVIVANAYAALNQHDGRIGTYIDALKREGRSKEGERELLIGLTKAYVKKGDLFRAAKTQDFFRSRYKSEKDTREAYIMLGGIEEHRGRTDRALRAYNKALALSKAPVDRRVLELKIGRLYYFSKKYKKAADTYKTSLAYLLDKDVLIDRKIVSDKVRDGLYFLADSFYQIGEWDDCLSTYQRTLKLFPNDKRAHLSRYYLAQSLRNLGRNEEAMMVYQELVDSTDEFWREVGSMKTEIIKWGDKHELFEAVTAAEKKAVDQTVSSGE